VARWRRLFSLGLQIWGGDGALPVGALGEYFFKLDRDFLGQQHFILSFS
jgi:hypothetical protein